MDGFLNWFVAEKIFGTDFSLIGTRLANLRCASFAGQCEMELIYSGEVRQPPAKWCGYPWEKVYLRLLFDGVREYHAKLHHPDDFTVHECSVNAPAQGRVVLTLRCENGDFIEIESLAVQIGNIKPLVYDEKAHDYTVPVGI